MQRKKAIVVGHKGQDGTYLVNRLRELNYEVTGIGRNDIDITDIDAVKNILSSSQPDEVYFVAAYHNSSEDKLGSDTDLYKGSMQINTNAVFTFLEAIFLECPACKFFYASSCLIFPPAGEAKHTESSEVAPMSYYSISKISGMMICRYFREHKNIFASTGILYNHESPLRKENFLTKKISMSVARIAKEGKGELIIGNIDAIVDWGYAPDYANAMQLILQLDKPDDFIIATGKEHSVKEYLDIAFSHAGLDYRKYVKVMENAITRKPLTRIGDASKLTKLTGWAPTISFEDMVRSLVDSEIESIS